MLQGALSYILHCVREWTVLYSAICNRVHFVPQCIGLHSEFCYIVHCVT
jgi:hypothetical protein